MTAVCSLAAAGVERAGVTFEPPLLIGEGYIGGAAMFEINGSLLGSKGQSGIDPNSSSSKPESI